MTKTMTKAQERTMYDMKIANKIGEFNSDKDTFREILPFLYSMRRWEKQMQRLAELDCNGYPKEVIEWAPDHKSYRRYNVEDLELKARCEKREEKLREKIEKLAAEFKLKVEFQGDPRGAMFFLITPDGQPICVCE